MSRKRRRISFETAAVYSLFLAAPDKPRFGLEVADGAGIASGSLYPILIRAEKLNILTSAPEPDGVAREAGRYGGRRRRYYQLTPHGRRLAEEEVREWREAVAVRAKQVWVTPEAGARA